MQSAADIKQNSMPMAFMSANLSSSFNFSTSSNEMSNYDGTYSMSPATSTDSTSSEDPLFDSSFPSPGSEDPLSSASWTVVNRFPYQYQNRNYSQYNHQYRDDEYEPPIIVPRADQDQLDRLRLMQMHRFKMSQAQSSHLPIIDVTNRRNTTSSPFAIPDEELTSAIKSATSEASKLLANIPYTIAAAAAVALQTASNETNSIDVDSGRLNRLPIVPVMHTAQTLAQIRGSSLNKDNDEDVLSQVVTPPQRPNINSDFSTSLSRRSSYAPSIFSDSEYYYDYGTPISMPSNASSFSYPYPHNGNPNLYDVNTANNNVNINDGYAYNNNDITSNPTACTTTTAQNFISSTITVNPEIITSQSESDMNYNSTSSSPSVPKFDFTYNDEISRVISMGELPANSNSNGNSESNQSQTLNLNSHNSSINNNSLSSSIEFNLNLGRSRSTNIHNDFENDSENDYLHHKSPSTYSEKFTLFQSQSYSDSRKSSFNRRRRRGSTKGIDNKPRSQSHSLPITPRVQQRRAWLASSNKSRSVTNLPSLGQSLIESPLSKEFKTNDGDDQGIICDHDDCNHDHEGLGITVNSTPLVSSSSCITTPNSTNFREGNLSSPQSLSPSPTLTPTSTMTAAAAMASVTAAVNRRGRKPSLTDDASKTFVCTYCFRRFRRQEHLKRHYRSLHTHEKPFGCDVCGKKFSRSDNLAQHMRTHSR